MTTYCLNPNQTWLAVYNLNTATMPTNNTVFSELIADLSANWTSATIKAWEWSLFEVWMIATIEQLNADKKATAREVVLISWITDNVLTLTRWYEKCVMDDTASPKVLWNTKQAFTSWARISVYVSKALLNWVQTRLSQVNCPCNTQVYNDSLALSSCVESNYDDLWNWVVQKYYECCWDYWYWTGCDWNCVVDWIVYLEADKIYKFCNLTICEWGCIRFINEWLPQIYVKENFINNWVLDLRGWMYVWECSLTRCWKTICNKHCLSEYEALCFGCGWDWWYWIMWRWCTGCDRESLICWWQWWKGWSCWTNWCSADWCNGWKGWTWWDNWCQWQGWGWGWGWWDFWNWGKGWTWWYGWWWRTNWWRWLWWSWGNAWIFGRWWDWWDAWSWCNYWWTDWWGWVWWKGWNGWIWWTWWVGDNGWWWNAWSYWFQWGKGWDWWDWIVCWGNGWWGNGNCGWNWGKAITNMYALFLSAKIICNYWDICWEWGKGWNGWYGTWYCSCYCQRKWWDWGCGWNGWDILTISEDYAVFWNITVAWGCGWTWGTSNYWSTWSAWANWTAWCHYCLTHILH